jgi:hypothetical protein
MRAGLLGRAEHSHQVWALDFQFDETADHRRLKLLNIVDEHIPEALAMRVGRTCDADGVVVVIATLTLASQPCRRHEQLLLRNLLFAGTRDCQFLTVSGTDGGARHARTDPSRCQQSSAWA